MLQAIVDNIFVDSILVPEESRTVNVSTFAGRVWKWLKNYLSTFFYNCISSISQLFETKAVSNSLTGKHITPHGYPKAPCPQQFQSQKKTGFDNQAILSKLPTVIENQRSNKTYKREKLEVITSENQNLPIDLLTPPNKIEYFSKGCTVFTYNSEGVRDYQWGCAWRTIQTSLSAYNIKGNFESLFHLFGSKNNLEHIYQDKYPNEKLSSSKPFAPYDLDNGWGEPFIAEMAMHFYRIPATLEAINDIPTGCTAPKQVFHTKPLGFAAFKEKLKNHFKSGNAAPVIIDDSVCCLNIIGIGFEGKNTILWMGDPHIKEGVNNAQNKDKPSGLYTIILDEIGKKLSCSLDHEDNHQLVNMFTKKSYEPLHFDTKAWMVLFPS